MTHRARRTAVPLAGLILVFANVALRSGGELWAQQPSVALGTSDGSSRAANVVLSRPVTLALNGVPLKLALDSVARVANVVVQYQVSDIQAYKALVVLHATRLSLGEVIERILNGTKLRAVVDQQGALAILPSIGDETDSLPDVGVVTGRVVDSATGRGLSGATLKVAGTKLSTVSADSGRFLLRSVPAGNQLLTVRLFGYRPAERSVTVGGSASTSVKVVMVAAPNVLSGVVTTATGVQRKMEVGSDITILNVDSVRQVAPISSVTDLLATRVPGLTVVHSSGAPGDPARLRLRGAASVQLNNDPIVIVDGIRVYAQQSDARNQNLAPSNGNIGGMTRGAYNAPSPLDQIDPSSIATIEVLKGPSASAIYGSDAASGVIVITTKRGQSGPAHWDVALSSGVNWIPGQWPTNYYRFGYNERSAGPFCTWYDVGCAVDSVVAFQALNDARYSVLTQGNEQQASAAVSGGVPTLTYNVSGATQSTLGNLKLPGSEVQRYDSLYGPIPRSLVRPDRYNTWGVTGSLVARPRQTVMVTLQSSLFNSTQQSSALGSAITQLSGEYVSPTILTGPLLEREYERAKDDQLTANNAMSLQWQARSWLPINATAGVSTVQRNDESYVPFGVYDGGFDNNGVCDDCADTTGSYGLGRGVSRVTTMATGTEIPTFQRRLTLALGGNVYTTSTADVQVYTNQLAPGVTTPTLFPARCSDGTVTCNSPTNQSTGSQSTYGWYVEPRLNMASRFFVAPGFRLDGGSGGAKSSGLGGLSGFPKMDLSYVAVDRQDDRPLWGFLSLLRPRLAFGYAGTQPAPADKLRLYNIGSLYTIATPGNQGRLTSSGTGCSSLVTLDGVTQTPAVCINALGNTVLRPERSSELEGGFDATLWQNRLSITYSQYNKTRHDAIIPIPVAQSVFSNGYGVFSIQKNIGVVRNTGTEVTLTAIPVQSRVFAWTVGANFSKNDNVVVRLNKGQLPIIMNGGTSDPIANPIQTRVQAGYPLFGEFVRPILAYADVNQDGVIEANEIRYGDSSVYVGQPDPNYQVNFTNDLVLFGGRLGIHAAFAYENGLTQYNQGACGSNSFNLLPNQPNTTFATQAAVVAAGCGLAGAQSVIGLVQVVNTFRFQSLSVNYTVPQAVSGIVRIPHMSVALQGENLGLHTNYRGKDPDVNAFSTVSAGDQTMDSGQIPEPRRWLLRITLGN